MTQNPSLVKWQWTGLVLVLLVVVGLVGLLFMQQQGYRSDAEQARQEYSAGTQGAGQGQTDDAGSGTDEGGSGSGSGDGSGESDGSEGSGEGEDSTAADPVAVMATAARDVIHSEEDVTISVLGDSTSDGGSEWVGRWAEQLGQDATVQVHFWNQETGTWYENPETYGQGERTVTIWNGSPGAATPAFPLEHEDLLQPEGADLTILNYGHRGQLEDLTDNLPTLLDELTSGEDSAPVLLTVQNPAAGDWEQTDAQIREAVRAEAEERGHPVIDIEAAFEEAGDPGSFLVDAVHPGDEGQQIWADAVSGFFAR